MSDRLIVLFLLVFSAQIACTGSVSNSTSPNTSTAASPIEGNGSRPVSDAAPITAGAKSEQPRTVRDFFMPLPEKYFLLEGCERVKDKDCRKAKIDYLETFAEIEDTANGYLKAAATAHRAAWRWRSLSVPTAHISSA